MQAQGYITAAQEQTAENQEIVFHPSPEALNVTAPHFALWVKDELIQKYGEQTVAHSGFIVKTTIDLDGQNYAQQVVESQVTRLARDNVSNGAAVVIDPTNGEILAMVGSHDWNDEQNGKINMALSPRQPGSSFKPIVYAKAFEDRLATPATVVEDKAIEFPGGYKPHNYDQKFHGKILLRFALANSLNIPAVLVMQQLGVNNAVDFAQSLGITTLNDRSKYGLSLVLGAAEVPLLQMTEAYATFADQGMRNDPTGILEIQDKNGAVIYTHTPSPERELSSAVAFQISSILSDNKARAMEFGNSLTISRPAAVKTGTTEDYRDALTLGFTPQVAVGAWVGNNDRAPMDNIAGSLGAAPIWRQLMEYFLKGKPVISFSQPDGILKMDVCRENGLRAEVATSSAYPEFFLPGTTPKSSCITPTPELSETPTPTPEEKKDEEEKETPTPTPTEKPKPTATTEPTNTPTPIVINPPKPLITDTPTPTL
jgi:membrane peptidoglycan carboxypeptidase